MVWFGALWASVAAGQAASEESAYEEPQSSLEPLVEELAPPRTKKEHAAFRAQLPADYRQARQIWLATMAASLPRRGGSLVRKDSDYDFINDWWDLCPKSASYEQDPEEDRKVGCPPGATWWDFGDPDSPPPYEPGDAEPMKDAPRGDVDGDGLAASDDRCPDEPEDYDDFQDEDGCPEDDNDHDGVSDALDKCMSEAETVNGYEDADGCPDTSIAALLDLSTVPSPAPAPVPSPFLRPIPELRGQPAPAPAPRPVATLPDIDRPLRTGASAPQDSAVVIGLEDYAFIPDVPYARRDAEAFQTFLIYSRGVPSHRIRSLTGGAVEHIRNAVAEAGRETGPKGRVWVYFAGHGAASPQTRERMLLGDDVRADTTSFEARAISVQEIEKLASAGGAEVMLVLDTCFAGVGRAGDTLMANARFSVPAFTAPQAPSVWEWNAAGPNQLSGPLEEARHGAFTYFAVGALRGWADGELSGVRDGRVTAEEAQVYVARALKARRIYDQAPVWVGAKSGAEVVLSVNAVEQGPEL